MLHELCHLCFREPPFLVCAPCKRKIACKIFITPSMYTTSNRFRSEDPNSFLSLQIPTVR